MSVIERAEQRLNEEERQHELGADNRYDLHYWAAYLDGARAQAKEDGVVRCGECKYFAAKNTDGSAGLCCGSHAYGVYENTYFCADGERKEK